MYIKYFVVLLSIAQAMKTPKEPPKKKESMSNHVDNALFYMEINSHHYRKAITVRRESYMQTIEHIKTYKNEKIQLEKVKEHLEYSIKNIAAHFSTLESAENFTSKESHLKHNTIFPSQHFISALFLMLENTVYVGEMYFNFPQMTSQILKTESRWNTTLKKSYKYIVQLINYMDISTYAVVSKVHPQLQKRENDQSKIPNENKKLEL